MKPTIPKALVVVMSLIICPMSSAGMDAFSTGPIIADLGPASVGTGWETPPADSQFKIAFDVSNAAEEDRPNQQLMSAARLLNLHGKLGLSAKQTKIAIVVHGAAAIDLTEDNRFGKSNPSASLIQALIDADVEIILCGQTAAYRDISAEDVLPGVVIQASAMTAHAILQNKGFSLNPF